jgi:hypothetical protein
MRRFLAAFAFVTLFGAASTPALAGNRLALVVGNDAYEHITPLQKAVADARSFAAVLREKGYNVRQGYDLSRDDLDADIAAFIDSIKPGDTAVFVYSGHGWSDGAQNYIVGVDAPATASAEYLSRISVPIKNGGNGVIDDMERKGAALKVAIVDACRDNPFTPPAGGRNLELVRGLAPMEAPAGTFVVYSASAGQAALDRLSDADDDPNSVFMRVFLPLLRANLSLQDAIKASQLRVASLAGAAGKEQKPAYYDEVVGPACLSTPCQSSQSADARPIPTPAAEPAPEPANTGRAVVEGFYLALAVADGERASRFVVPERRVSGPFSAEAMSRYYASLEGPLRLISVTMIDAQDFEARYVFRAPGGHVCNGDSIVAVTRVDGAALIKSIHALSGC